MGQEARGLSVTVLYKEQNSTELAELFGFLTHRGKAEHLGQDHKGLVRDYTENRKGHHTSRGKSARYRRERKPGFGSTWNQLEKESKQMFFKN